MIYLSCGHEVDDFAKGYYVITKSVDRENKRALSYEIVCLECKKLYEEKELLFYNEDDAMDWVTEEDTKRYIADVEEDPETGELYLKLTDEMCDELGWTVGDNLKWTDNGDGSWSLTKVDINS